MTRRFTSLSKYLLLNLILGYLHALVTAIIFLLISTILFLIEEQLFNSLHLFLSALYESEILIALVVIILIAASSYLSANILVASKLNFSGFAVVITADVITIEAHFRILTNFGHLPASGSSINPTGLVFLAAIGSIVSIYAFRKSRLSI